jgi:hypothetical protein
MLGFDVFDDLEGSGMLGFDVCELLLQSRHSRAPFV